MSKLDSRNAIIVDEKAINNVITNSTARKVIYSVYVLLGVVIGSIQVAYGFNDLPQYLTVAVNVYIYLGLPIGALAFTNSPTEKHIKKVEETVDVERINNFDNYFIDKSSNKVYDIEEDSDRKPKH